MSTKDRSFGAFAVQTDDGCVTAKPGAAEPGGSDAVAPAAGVSVLSVRAFPHGRHRYIRRPPGGTTQGWTAACGQPGRDTKNERDGDENGDGSKRRNDPPANRIRTIHERW